MYLHVITSGIRNRTCTWQENIDLVQDMIIIGGHLYLKCNFNRVWLNCSLILWLNYSLLQLINLQNDLIKNTIRMTVVNLFLKIFACYIVIVLRICDLLLFVGVFTFITYIRWVY